ncbi:MAG: ATP-binding protein [Bacteroidales bacterium]|nr:ATP-binding protein [Bacteroidales bacterium]
MVYKKFRTNVLIRVIVLSATIFLFFYSLETRFYLTPVLIGIVIVMQIVWLFRYTDRTNRELAGFLESIRYAEFNRSFRIEGMGESFNELAKAFNDVIKDFQAVRSEKEEHFHYLQSIVQNIDVSIIAFQRDGSVELVNKAAKKLFQVATLKNIHLLEPLSKELVQTLLSIQPGENRLVKVQDYEDLLQLSINATELRIKDKEIVLVAIKNIQSVLEEQETEAWQKLIRVLTHEIMNSITPIASLSSTLDIMLKDIIGENKSGNLVVDMDTVNEIQQALQTINKRSTGLLHFVNTYRNLTRIPQPNFRILKVHDLFSHISLLLEEEMKKNGIRFIMSVEPHDLEISVDEQLIEQVLLNLIKNSMHALEGRKDPVIELKAFLNKRGRATLQVYDNGQGILPDVIDKIFIPFFTTKPSGSGIGLSLSRQIIRLHNGTITASSTPGKETVFTMTF